MREIKDKNGNILARHITPEDFKPGLSFFSDDSEFVQVGIWGHYEEGKILANHIHKEVERKAYRTCESIYIVTGSLEAEIFDLEQEHVDKFVVKQGEILVLLSGGHGYRILEEDTTVYEVKNGPFPGVEADKLLF